MKKSWITAGIIALALLRGCEECPAAVIQDSQATNAIVGEAGSECWAAQVAVASAIRNRGSLQGVYGVGNPVVSKASAKVRARAFRAWKASAQGNAAHGLKFFGCKSDAPYFKAIGLHPAMQIGAITFWK